MGDDVVACFSGTAGDYDAFGHCGVVTWERDRRAEEFGRRVLTDCGQDLSSRRSGGRDMSGLFP